MASSHQQDAQQAGMVECLGQEMHHFRHKADLKKGEHQDLFTKCKTPLTINIFMKILI